MKNPLFELTNQIVSDVAEIAERVGWLTANNRPSANPFLRRRNRIKTIYDPLPLSKTR